MIGESSASVRDLKVHPRVSRSYEQHRLDRFHRQLLHSTEHFGFYARLFYLEEDDSFFLEWRVPDEAVGSKYYSNPDECFFSLQQCVKDIAVFCEAFHGVLVDRAQVRITSPIPRRDTATVTQ